MVRYPIDGTTLDLGEELYLRDLVATPVDNAPPPRPGSSGLEGRLGSGGRSGGGWLAAWRVARAGLAAVASRAAGRDQPRAWWLALGCMTVCEYPARAWRETRFDTAATGIAADVARTNGGDTEVESERSARSAGLRYVSDGEPGITRRRRGRGFQYLDPSGATISNRKERSRIESLAIPPAWTDVWICRSPTAISRRPAETPAGASSTATTRNGDRYRDETKYHALRRSHGRCRGYGGRWTATSVAAARSRRVVATVVRLLDATTIRVGNDEYARDNGSFGLTTLRDRHVELNGDRIVFRFRGKGGKVHEVDIADPRVARVIKRCEELPGQHLFQYVGDDGEPADVKSDDVNDYLRSASGDEFTAKDFRTWTGTVLAAWTLDELARSKGGASRRPSSFPRSSRLHTSSGTRRPCVARVMYTPTSSTPTSTGRFGRAFGSVQDASSHETGRSPGRRRAVLSFLERRL